MNADQIAEYDQKSAERIRRLASSGDRELDHLCADKELVGLLTVLGCSKTVEAFNAVKKYYS